MTDQASVLLPKDLVEGAIRTQVAAAMVAALGDKAALIETCVHRVLTQKVDRDGNVGRGYGNDEEFIQWAMKTAVVDAVKSVITEEVGKYKDTMRKHIAAQLSRKNSPLLKQLVDNMTEAVTTAAANKWMLTVNFGTRD